MWIWQDNLLINAPQVGKHINIYIYKWKWTWQSNDYEPQVGKTSPTGEFLVYFFVFSLVIGFFMFCVTFFYPSPVEAREGGVKPQGDGKPGCKSNHILATLTYTRQSTDLRHHKMVKTTAREFLFF